MPSAEEMAVVEVVVGGLRWVVVLLGAYLAVSAVASFAVHGLRLHRLVRAVDAVTLPPVRRLARAMVGVGVAAGTFAAAAPAGASMASADAPAPVMRRLGNEAAPTARAEQAPPAEPASRPPATEWRVRPGDHFWRIAEEVLAAQLHRSPSDHETDPYWRRLVSMNRDRLADRGNPDLLFPGQVLLLPTTS